MTALRVAGADSASTNGDLAAVIASLPASLVGAQDHAHADLVAIDGTAQWARLAAEKLAQQIRGLLIVHPTPVSPNDIPEGSFVPVVVDYRFAGNPAVPGAAELLRDWPSDALFEVTAVVPDAGALGETLIDQLATLRRLGHSARELTRLSWTSDGFYLRGSTTDGGPILLAAHVTTGLLRALQLRSLAANRTLQLDLPDPSTARPAVLVHSNPTGATTSPTLWETSHRAAWRRLHRAAIGLRLTNDLFEIHTDLKVAGQVLPPPV